MDLFLPQCTSEFPTFTPVKEKLNPQWFRWLTKTQPFWAQCDEKSRGTSGKNRIRPEQFLKILIPLPPLEEQQRIVARIDKLAGKIEEARGLRQEVIAETEFLITSAARRALDEVDVPATPLQYWLDQQRDGIQTGPFGAQLSSSDFIDAGVPLLTIGNIQYNGLRLDGLKHVSDEKAKLLSRFTVKAGDLLFARMGTVGRCCIVPEEAEGWLINYHIIRVALDQMKVEPRYIHWTIRASADVEAYLDDKTRGATREGVNSTIVGNLPCHIPSLNQQRRIISYLDGLQAKVETLQQLQRETAAELDTLLPSVLDKAFRGAL